MSTRGVKLLTGGLVLLCILLLVLWPIMMSYRPTPTSAIEVKKAFAVQFVAYVSFVILTLVGAGIGAIVIMRRTVAEVREAQMDNMKELIEATLASNQKKEPKADDAVE